MATLKHSTGAKTTEGKAKASLTAFKGGFREQLRNLSKFMREQCDQFNEIKIQKNLLISE